MSLVRGALAVLVVLLFAPVALAFAVPPAAVAAALASPDTQSALRTSLVASLASVGVSALLGVPAGYALARTTVFWRSLGPFGLALPLALLGVGIAEFSFRVRLWPSP